MHVFHLKVVLARFESQPHVIEAAQFRAPRPWEAPQAMKEQTIDSDANSETSVETRSSERGQFDGLQQGQVVHIQVYTCQRGPKDNVDSQQTPYPVIYLNRS